MFFFIVNYLLNDGYSAVRDGLAGECLQGVDMTQHLTVLLHGLNQAANQDVLLHSQLPPNMLARKAAPSEFIGLPHTPGGSSWRSVAGKM